MDAATRERFTSGTGGPLAANANWQTPPQVFAKLNQDFGPFDLDLCADIQNALLPRWLGPGSTLPGAPEDALVANWTVYGKNGYANPPYGDFVARLLPWARFMAAAGCDSTLLLPLRVTEAFQKHILRGASQLYFCDRRITFYERGFPRPDKMGRPMPALFDSIIVRYMHGYTPTTPYVDLWRVPPHTVRLVSQTVPRSKKKKHII